MNKYNKESSTVVCGEFNKEDRNDFPMKKILWPPSLSDKERPLPSLSPITTQCDKDKSLELHIILPDLLTLDFDEKR